MPLKEKRTWGSIATWRTEKVGAPARLSTRRQLRLAPSGGVELVRTEESQLWRTRRRRVALDPNSR